MASQTTPIFQPSADKRKDDSAERPAGNSHAHILPAPVGNHGDHMKFQPTVATLQKATIMTRPIAPAPLTTQLAAAHTLAQVGQAQSIAGGIPSSTLVAAATTSTLIATSGSSLSHPLTTPSTTAPGVSQPGMLQLAPTVSATPINSVIRGAAISQSGGHLQFPSHLPKGAAAAVSALTGPKSGQTVATAILRPAAASTIQIPASPGALTQPYHQHIQPRGGALQGSLVGPVRPGTPPMTRAGSPVITSQLQQQLEHSQSQARTSLAQPLAVPNSVQITLQPQRTAVDIATKLQPQRAATETGGKGGSRMLVEPSTKVQGMKPDSSTKLQTARNLDTTLLGYYQRTAGETTLKGQGSRTGSDSGTKIHLQRTTVDASKVPQPRPGDTKILPLKPTDLLGKMQPQRATTDASGKSTTHRIPMEIPNKLHVQRTAIDPIGKVQSQKPLVDTASKVSIDSSGKVQLQRTTLEGVTGKPQVVRTLADSSEKVQIQRVPRDPPGKMLPHRPCPDPAGGKALPSHHPQPQSKAVHVPQPYTSATLSSSVVLAQVPTSSMVNPPQQGGHQPISSKPIKTGMMTPSAANSSTPLNTPLSVPSLATMATSTAAGITTTVATTIPIAKVTPQRHHQTQLAPLPSSAVSQGVVSVATGTGSVTVQDITRADMHVPGQPPGGSVYMSTVNRGWPVSAAVTSTVTVGAQATHGDSRPDRPGVAPMGQFIGSEYYNYGMGPYQTTMVYPSVTTAQGISQASLRPRLITSPTPNLAASLQTSIHGTASVSRFPSGMLQVDPSRQLSTHFNSGGSAEGSNVISDTPVTAGLTYTLSPAGPTITSSQPSQNSTGHSSAQSASPRPSILRKRASDGTPVKKPYCALNESPSPRPESAPQSNTSSPKTPVTESRENSQSSTDTALSNEAAPLTSEVKVKQEIPDSTDNVALTPVLNNVEASPRKKPRKQQLSAVEELKDSTSTDEELERHLDVKEERREPVKQEVKEDYYDDEGVRWTSERTKPNISLLNFYSCSWKARNNHFLRCQDVKPKEERRPTVNELSNSKSVVQKATGWRLYYMASQLEDLADLEKEMCSGISEIQMSLAPSLLSHQTNATDSVAANRVHELTQGNIQRCQLVNDQLVEARNSMLKILDHKKRILEIINKHMSKRPIKKKERS